MKRTGGAREEVGGRFVGNRELCVGGGKEVAGAHSQMRRRGGVRKKRRGGEAEGAEGKEMAST